MQNVNFSALFKFVKKQNCRNLSLIRLAARETRDVKEEFDACSGRLTEACNFKTQRLQCYFGFDEVRTGGGPRLSEISCTYDPPIYDITSGCKVAALFSRKALRWSADAIWFLRYFNQQANGIMYLECREC